MSIPAAKWKRLWQRFSTREESEEDADLREVYVRTGLRVAAAFAIIFGAVFFAFWWSGSAMRFGAARAAGQAAPTWRVKGTVRNAITHEPIPWAVVDDDPAGRPPYYRTDANYAGVYELVTLAEPHVMRVSAPGYRSASVRIGRIWFLWLPRGEETKDMELGPL
jgi:hypothetical protein